MNSEMLDNNKVYLQGTVETEPELNHTVMGDEFYSFKLKVPRLSGQCDIIPITISGRFLQVEPIQVGDKLALRGQFRSYNKVENEKRKLMLSVFVQEILEWDDTANPNVIELCGYICKPAIYRTTPFSRQICDVLLAVNRNYNKSDYIPCIAWGSTAQLVSKLDVATKLNITGRIQSREYNKHIEGLEIPITKVAYEVSVSRFQKEENEPTIM